MDAETQAAFGTLCQQVDQQFARVDQRFERVDQRFAQVDEQFVETRRHFHVVEESLRSDMGLLAEGLTLRIDRLETTLRDEIVRSHDALASLIRRGYTDLDRRVRALEQQPRSSE